MLKQIAKNVPLLFGPHTYCDQVKMLDSHACATKPKMLDFAHLRRNKANLFKVYYQRAIFSHESMQKTEAKVR